MCRCCPRSPEDSTVLELEVPDSHVAERYCIKRAEKHRAETTLIVLTCFVIGIIELSVAAYIAHAGSVPTWAAVLSTVASTLQTAVSLWSAGAVSRMIGLLRDWLAAVSPQRDEGPHDPHRQDGTRARLPQSRTRVAPALALAGEDGPLAEPSAQD